MPVQVRVVSVEASLFEGEADFLLCRGTEGELGILPRHSPLLTALKPGLLTVRSGGDTQELFVGGGFLEILPDRVTVLADVAERADEIDEQAAEQARKRAEERLSGDLSPDEQRQIQLLLEQAEERLRLSRVRRSR